MSLEIFSDQGKWGRFIASWRVLTRKRFGRVQRAPRVMGIGFPRNAIERPWPCRTGCVAGWNSSCWFSSEHPWVSWRDHSALGETSDLISSSGKPVVICLKHQLVVQRFISKSSFAGKTGRHLLEFT